ncbi:hypothetical protein LWI28_004750 [Acer negundo]|uniref:Uncharacterized protein n=1 Tax=Acer negundo TaxID=4023 RepID=A0AAD5IZ03_ACENE|nr:hypothetical protein LWI28_004750 [Acer negundo]
MSSTSLFRSVLLSKPPRVGYFHGSHINSAEFVVSFRFSGVKFNASPCSNLMCCSVNVTNFVKSTACSSTSKIANFVEAEEIYFEKVLIDRILKALKWLKIPAVLVLLLTMTMSGRRGDSALATSSGVIVDHRSISSSSYESSALNQQHGSSSRVVYIIIFVSAVLVYFLRNESTRGQTKVIKFEVKRCNSREEAATYYLKLSNKEQKKYDHLNEIIR